MTTLKNSFIYYFTIVLSPSAVYLPKTKVVVWKHIKKEEKQLFSSSISMNECHSICMNKIFLNTITDCIIPLRAIPVNSNPRSDAPAHRTRR